MLSFGLNLESPIDYITFFISMLQALTIAGVTTRVIFKLYKAFDTDDGLAYAFKQSKKLILVGILAITIGEIIELIAQAYYT